VTTDLEPVSRGGQASNISPMDQDHTIDADPFTRFADYVEREKSTHVGRDISDNDNDRQYVPPAALARYWTPERMGQVQSAFGGKCVFNVRLVMRSFLQVFSTLVYSGPDFARHLPNFIRHNLCDVKFPLIECPKHWGTPVAPVYKALFDTINKWQWMFFPLVFEPHSVDNRLLDPRQILPFGPPKMLRQGDAASIQTVVIHDSCNRLVSEVGSL
jgi:hypothetical protein